MSRGIVARGTLSDPRHIELAEPITGIQGEVELMICQIPHNEHSHELFNLISRLAPGSRPKTEIDRQVRDERASWADR